MFVSHPDSEFPFPAALGPPGARYYQIVELSTRLAWFLVTFQIKDEHLSLTHSVCCSSESELLNLLQSRPNHAVTALQQVKPSGDRNGSWKLRTISHVWRAWDDVARQRVVIFEDDEGVEFVGDLSEELHDRLTDRALVMQVGGPQSVTRRRSMRAPRLKSRCASPSATSAHGQKKDASWLRRPKRP